VATVLKTTGTQKDAFAPASSFMMSVEYHPEQAAMTITFKNGSQFRYLQVFPSTWVAFKTAPDHSAFYAQSIKGRLRSVPVIKKNIGKNPNQGVHTHVQRTAGNSNAVTRGTVNRAFSGIVGRSH
jgi:hypothetical protein